MVESTPAASNRRVWKREEEGAAGVVRTGLEAEETGKNDMFILRATDGCGASPTCQWEIRNRGQVALYVARSVRGPLVSDSVHVCRGKRTTSLSGLFMTTCVLD